MLTQFCFVFEEFRAIGKAIMDKHYNHCGIEKKHSGHFNQLAGDDFCPKRVGTRYQGRRGSFLATEGHFRSRRVISGRGGSFPVAEGHFRSRRTISGRGEPFPAGGGKHSGLRIFICFLKFLLISFKWYFLNSHLLLLFSSMSNSSFLNEYYVLF